MQLLSVSPIPKSQSRTMKTTHLFIRVVSSETLTRLLNRERIICLPSQCVMRAFQICIYLPWLYDEPWLIFKVRRNETICCLIGFGIGVGCCILYRLISNFLTSSSTSSSLPSSSTAISQLSNNKRDAKTSLMGQEHSSLSSNGTEITVTYTKRARSNAFKRSTPERYLINPTKTKKTFDDDSSNPLDSDREPLLGLPIDKHHEYIPSKNLITSNLSDEMTWSEISSSLGTVGLLHDSYHSNSLTGDSGVDCQEISIIKSSRHSTTSNPQRFDERTPTIPMLGEDDDDDDDDEETSFMNYSITGMSTFLHGAPRRYDSDTALSRGVLLQDTQNVHESNVMSYMSTEKGLERALEQTSRFYSDLEHIATDLNSLSRKYSQSHTALIPSVSKYYYHQNQHVCKTIDALDWDWNDVHASPIVQSPKSNQKKSHQHSFSSLPRLNSNTKSKVRRKLNPTHLPTDYNESDLELRTSRSYDCTSSPLRRRPSSVYFDSTDNTSGDENLADETLQIPSSPEVLTSSQTTEFFLS